MVTLKYIDRVTNYQHLQQNRQHLTVKGNFQCTCTHISGYEWVVSKVDKGYLIRAPIAIPNVVITNDGDVSLNHL